MNTLQQRARFDERPKEFNEERPHEALAMKTPAGVYAPSRGPAAAGCEICPMPCTAAAFPSTPAAEFA
jgi:hypothetical protein